MVPDWRDTMFVQGDFSFSLAYNLSPPMPKCDTKILEGNKRVSKGKSWNIDK